MELNEITKALYDWAEADNKRSVVCIATEMVNETEEGYSLSTSTAINGKKGILVNAIADMMKEDEGLADIIQTAFLSYVVENKKPAIGTGITVARKEGKDE